MPKSVAKTKGRATYKQFMGIPKQVLESDSYKLLNAWSVKVIVDIAKQFNGNNNGDLCASWSIMKDQGWKSPSTLNKAVIEAQERGFIVLTRQGGRNKASLYGVTWYPIDDCKGKLDVKPTTTASNLWKQN